MEEGRALERPRPVGPAPGRVAGRGVAQGIHFAGVLLKAPVLGLETVGAGALLAVAALPLAARHQRHSEHQAEHEDEGDDEPLVGGEESHGANTFASLEDAGSMAAGADCSAPGTYLNRLSEIEQLAGPRMTMNSTGRMNRISGTVMIAGSLAAFSSARIIRSLRNSAASTRSALASGVPYFSVWIMVVTTPRTASRSIRLARFSKAERRSLRKPSSMAVRPNSSPSSG